MKFVPQTDGCGTNSRGAISPLAAVADVLNSEDVCGTAGRAIIVAASLSAQPSGILEFR